MKRIWSFLSISHSTFCGSLTFTIMSEFAKISAALLASFAPARL